MTTVVDTSAVLAILRAEPGADVAAASSRGAMLSAVNLVEFRSKAIELGADLDAAVALLARLEISIVPFTAAQAKVAADLWPMVRRKGVSLADRACLALAMERGATLVTADRAWATLDLDIDYVFIR